MYRKKLIRLMFLVSLLGLANSTVAAIWTEPAISISWYDSNNRDGLTVPGPTNPC